MEDFLRALAPSRIDERRVAGLLSDYGQHVAASAEAAHGLLPDESLALYAYTYEFKLEGTGEQRVLGLRGQALQDHVDGILDKLDTQRLVSDVLVREAWSGERLLGHMTDPFPVVTMQKHGLPMTDSVKLLRVWEWLQQPAADDSHPFQLYRDMNAAMRGFEQDPAGVAPFLPLIYYACNGRRKLPKPAPTAPRAPTAGGGADPGWLVVYRGLDLWVPAEAYRPGSTICWPAFCSTSASVKVAKSFLGSTTEGTLFILEVATARDVSGHSRFKEEAEFLLPPQALFRVKGFASPGVRQILELPDAVQILELRELREAETDVEFAMAKASRLYKEGSKIQAIKEYWEAGVRYPDTAMGRYCAGMALFWDRQGHLRPEGVAPEDYHRTRQDRAHDCFAEALECDSTHPMLLSHYAWSLKVKEEWASARLNFHRALQVDPWLTDALHGMATVAFAVGGQAGRILELGRRYVAGQVSAARHYQWRGNHKGMRACLLQAYVSDPSNEEAHGLLRGLLDADLSRRLDEAQHARPELMPGQDPLAVHLMATELKGASDHPFWKNHCQMAAGSAHEGSRSPPGPVTLATGISRCRQPLINY